MSPNVYIFFRARALHLLHPQYSATSLLAVNDMMQKKTVHEGLSSCTVLFLFSPLISFEKESTGRIFFCLITVFFGPQYPFHFATDFNFIVIIHLSVQI